MKFRALLRSTGKKATGFEIPAEIILVPVSSKRPARGRIASGMAIVSNLNPWADFPGLPEVPFCGLDTSALVENCH